MADLLNSIGVVFILAAFLLLTAKRTGPHSLLYNVLNLIGSALAATGSYMMNSVPFTVLNVAWVGVAAYALLKKKNRNL